MTSERSKRAKAEPLSPVAECLLGLLPQDGAPVTNRAARAVVSKRLGRNVGPDEYFGARDQLLAVGLVGRVRGQGGSVSLLAEPVNRAPIDAEAQSPLAPAERGLMEPFGRALAESFVQFLDLPTGTPRPIIEDISTKGPRRGVWARPDFLLVAASRFAILPGTHVEVHVFELKNESGGGVRAVHEALAQRRFAHFAHLAWYLPVGSSREAELEDVATHCALHGIGLLRMTSIAGPLDMVVEAQRSVTTLLEIDGFLESRLSEPGRAELAAAVARSGGNQ